MTLPELLLLARTEKYCHDRQLGYSPNADSADAYLSKSRSAHDRRLINLRMLANLVAGPIARHTAHSLGIANRARVIAVVLNNIVLRKRRVDPAIDRQVRGRSARVRAAEVDHAVGGSGRPAEADDEVAGVVPVGVDVAAALVVAEVGEVAVVVLDVVDGLAFDEGVGLLGLGCWDWRGEGGAGQGGENGGEFHVG